MRNRSSAIDKYNVRRICRRRYGRPSVDLNRMISCRIVNRLLTR